ncbi:ABC transporter permease subunit [Rubrobacter tropicus]|uniref:ABC transporter permease subunit n=1 Tax=Rubrobacter tropicus TaxID=2653851 RepID=A0A6G8QEE5_9ACTN|nr:ABC transporter permease subunit [Rubrobacter tropicus]QIN84874.1 ABC transporter permease subunit [Rubrobacter tropicus]
MGVLGLRKAGGRGKHSARRAAPLTTLSALVFHTTKMQSRGALIWGAALGLYSAAIVASFTTFSGSADQMNQLLEAYPEGMLEAFGITDLADVENYMNSQVFLLAPLALAFFPILAAAGTIAGAEERGTIDVLLGNPIPRWQLVVGSFASMAFSLLAILALMGVLTQATAFLMDVNLPVANTAAAVLNMWPLCLVFGAAAMLCSAVFHRRALAIAIPAFLLFAMYLLDTLGRVSEDLEDLQPASAFYYYGSAIEDGIDWTNFWGLTLVAVALVLLAVPAFRHRDIYT